MASGTVKWFNHEKGFGFITPDDAGRDLFVHQSQVEGGGALADGAKVEFESEESDKGPRAVNVRTIYARTHPSFRGAALAPPLFAF